MRSRIRVPLHKTLHPTRLLRPDEPRGNRDKPHAHTAGAPCGVRRQAFVFSSLALVRHSPPDLGLPLVLAALRRVAGLLWDRTPGAGRTPHVSPLKNHRARKATIHPSHVKSNRLLHRPLELDREDGQSSAGQFQATRNQATRNGRLRRGCVHLSPSPMVLAHGQLRG